MNVSIQPPRRSSRMYLRTAMVCLCACLLHGKPQTASQPPIPSSEEPRVTIVPRPKPETKSKADIRVDVNLVLIPVTVTDPMGKPVLGLPADAFQIFEDGVEQPIARLTHQDTPLSVGLVFDASASMQGKLDKSRAAIIQLLKTTMPGDEYFLVQFNNSARLLSGFTSDGNEIQDALQSILPEGWTSLLDAVYLSLSQMKKAHNPRRALVVLSD